jgi:hypothetical protein
MCEPSSFQDGEKLILFQRGLFSRDEETHVSLERKPSTLVHAASSPLCLCENWSSIWKKILPAKWSFQSGERLIFFQIGLSVVLTKHTYFQGNPLVLEAWAPGTLFPFENWVPFWEECFLQLTSFKVGIGSVCSKRPMQLSWRNTCISWRINI